VLERQVGQRGRVEAALRADVEPGREAGGGDGRVPGHAVGDDGVRGAAGGDALEVEPRAHAGGLAAREAVRCLQRALVAAAAGTLVVDGLFGPATRRAVEAYQRGAGLPITGVADDATWTALAR
jgi:peptidoglycan hydrolase-like protein with peptidoglycan-binding domain